jgi:hypothetical protein
LHAHPGPCRFELRYQAVFFARRNQIPWSCFTLTAVIKVLPLACRSAVAESVHYEPVSRAFIEAAWSNTRGMAGSALIRSGGCFLRRVATAAPFRTIRERVEARKCYLRSPGQFRQGHHGWCALIFIAKKLHVAVTGVNVDQIGSTDSVQFSERKIPSITIHSLTREPWSPRLRTGIGRSLPKVSSLMEFARLRPILSFDDH